MKMLPTPPASLWLSSRDGFANYSTRNNAVSTHKDEEQSKLSINLAYPNAMPGAAHVKFLNFPESIWELGKRPPAAVDFIEGALAHAVLLARGGAASGIPADSHRAKDIGNVEDLAKTIQTIRTRLWSIQLEMPVQQAIYGFICDLLARIEDPAGRAYCFNDVFDGVAHSTNIGPPASKLARLPSAAACVVRATAWTTYVLEHHEKGSANFSRSCERANRSVDHNLFISLGAPSAPIQAALRIDRGFDLMAMGATARWMREIHHKGTKGAFNIEGGHQHHFYAIPGLLNRMDGVYGATEINPARRRENEQYVKAAIKRLTDYKRNLQKRQAKVTPG